MLARKDLVAKHAAVSTLSQSASGTGIVWAGTDEGNLYVTTDCGTCKKAIAKVIFDGQRSNEFGKTWKATKTGIPLAAGAHGRSVWILDSISALEEARVGPDAVQLVRCAPSHHAASGGQARLRWP